MFHRRLLAAFLQLCALFVSYTIAVSAVIPRGGAGSPMEPMCTAISGGCAEAWGLSEAPAPSYSGPLFQLSNGSSTLDIGQTTNNKADMTTWSAFCGGINTTTTSNGVSVVKNSVCRISKIYAEVQGHANDLVPSVFVGSGVDCSDGGTTCACPFAYEVATGLPVIASTLAVCEYTLTSDQSATGIIAGTHALSIIVNGVANIEGQCCGSIGMSHPYNGGDVEGSMFQLGTNYGQNPYPEATCATATTYCLLISTEISGNQTDFPSLTIGEPLLMSANYDPVADKFSAWANSTLLFTQTPNAPTIDVGGSVRVAGGGDLSQPADTFAREFAATNTAVSQTDVTNAFQQIQRNFVGLLTFGPL